jgi:hypothetical protein
VFSAEVFTAPAQEVIMLSVLISVLIICVVGAICFWAIDKFVRDGRLVNLLKLLVVLICLGRSFNGCCRWRELIGCSRACVASIG